MRKLLLIVLLLTVGEICTYGQKNQRDSELKSLWDSWNNEDLTDSTRLNAMDKLISDQILNHLPDSASYLIQLQYDFAKDKGNLYHIAKALNNRGILLKYNRQLDSAAVFFGQALNIQKELEDKTGMAATLLQFGIVYRRKGEFDLALNFFNQGLAVCKEIGDRLILGRIMHGLGSFYRAKGEYARALSYYKRSLAIKQETGDINELAKTFKTIGRVYRDIGEFTKAITFYNQGLTLTEESEDKFEMPHYYIAFGILHKKKGDYIESIANYTKALNLLEVNGDKRGIAYCLNNLGNIYDDQDDFDKAIEYYTKSLSIKEVIEDANGIANSLTNIGNIYNKKGEPEEAMKYFDNSLKRMQELGDKKGIARNLQNIGVTYAYQHEYKKSVEYYTESLRIKEQINYKQGVIHSLNGLGLVHQALGDYNKGIEFGKRALKLAQEIELLIGIKEASRILYQGYKYTGRHALALQMHELYIASRDSLEREENQRAIIHREYKYLYDKKSFSDSLEFVLKEQAHGAALEKETNQRFALYMVLLIVLGFAIYVFYAWRVKTKLSNKIQGLINLQTRWFKEISHQQRTPLTLILGSLSDLRNSISINDKNKIKINRALEQGKLLKKMTDQIMDLARIEAQGNTSNSRRTDLSVLIIELFDSFKPWAQNKHIDYQLVFLPETPFWVLLDVDSFRTIVSNLIDNAIKYTQDHGRVVVSIDTIASSGLLKIEVRDTGRGISLQDKPHIFERYYQSVTAPPVDEGGAGIGLALVKELIERMNATIDVKSKMKQGSTFKVVIPIEKTFVEERINNIEPVSLVTNSSPPNEEIRNLSKDKEYTVLIAEDHAEMRNHLHEIIGPYYDVLFAENGEQAFKILETSKGSVDLLITDVMMPKLDGYGLLDKVKNNDKLSQLPVLMLTAKAEQKAKIKALLIGVDDYLVKPFDSTELLSRCRNLLKFRTNRLKNQILDEKKAITGTEEELSANQRFMKQVEVILQKEVGNSEYLMNNLAEQLKVSYRTLNRKIRNVTGLSPNHYFREIRLVEAHDLLISGKYRSVSEVSHAVGFEHAGYFTKVYFKRFGKKPSRYLYEISS